MCALPRPILPHLSLKQHLHSHNHVNNFPSLYTYSLSPPLVSTRCLFYPRHNTSNSTKNIVTLCGCSEGNSVFFTGCAGTGKSLLLKHILRALPRDSTFVTASTGLAASALGGITVNAFAGASTSKASLAPALPHTHS